MHIYLAYLYKYMCCFFVSCYISNILSVEAYHLYINMCICILIPIPLFFLACFLSIYIYVYEYICVSHGQSARQTIDCYSNMQLVCAKKPSPVIVVYTYFIYTYINANARTYMYI